ncbi:MAG: hypothetical protein KatS3mg102_2234 [Planctomycetota bacterium]|nr:MAG: hypothetical protein KatS3mg102_2234 [Planctomycetota bacterium]
MSSAEAHGPQKKRRRAEYDSPWKEAITHLLFEFLAFFFPKVHDEVDTAQPYQVLDKELRRLSPRAQVRGRLVDVLCRVALRSGEERWLLIHIEVQAEPDPRFLERVFSYSYRIYDRYGRMPETLVVLADAHPHWRPDRFVARAVLSRHELHFPVVKLLDFRERRAELERSRNPFAVITLAHLVALSTRGRPELRYGEKLAMLRRLYEIGLGRRVVRLLFLVVDWILALPAELDERLAEEIHAEEEKRKVRYISSIERVGIRKGREEGLQAGRLLALREAIVRCLEARFGPQARERTSQLERIQDAGTLERLVGEAATVASLEAFEELLRGS